MSVCFVVSVVILRHTYSSYEKHCLQKHCWNGSHMGWKSENIFSWSWKSFNFEDYSEKVRKQNTYFHDICKAQFLAKEHDCPECFSLDVYSPVTWDLTLKLQCNERCYGVSIYFARVMTVWTYNINSSHLVCRFHRKPWNLFWSWNFKSGI